MHALLLSLISTLLLSLTNGVDRDNFKTCDQSAFCKLQRATASGQSPYIVVMSSLRLEPTRLSLQLLDMNTQRRLLLELIGIADNTARLRINELAPVRPRYEPPIGDVLITQPRTQNLQVLHSDAAGIQVALQGNKIMVQANPLRIDFFVNNQPVVTVNAKGLLRLQFLQERKQHERAVEADVEEKEEEDGKQAAEGEEVVKDVEDEGEKKGEEEEDVLFEESFKGHSDTKRNGPSSVGLDISFPGVEYVYGIPEHADTLALKSTKSTDPYRLYNLDVFEYELDNPMALYGSVPMMMAHNEHRTVGIFWLNAAETWVDISSVMADKTMFTKLVDFVKGDTEIPQVDTHWFSESGIIDVFFMFGPKPADVFRQYAALTGTTPLPPLFAIAYHQSRWNYNDEEDVASVDSGFDKHDIPLDVIWLDIEHTDGKRYFTWDAQKFPHSVDMIDRVAAKGRKMVTIVDPHIKHDDNYHVHKEAKDKGYYVKDKHSNNYEGWCWPGTSGWLDFVNPAVRDFWAGLFRPTAYVGSTLDLFTWNDMNEPSVFNGPEITMHKDALHHGDWEHRDVHNLYGMYVHRATVEGQLLRSDNQHRPFVLSRAFFAGSQRYGAVWTGDNIGDWSHLKVSLPMVMSLNLVGISLSGADIGGFFRNPDPELLTRWYQAAAYQPFFRAHAHLDTRRREPWLLPADNTLYVRAAIRDRYALLPYWYTLFYRSERSGMPVMRPLWVDFPAERDAFAVQDQHTVGSALLVHPVTDAGATGVHVYFPGPNEVWYDVKTYQRYPSAASTYVAAPLGKIPVFQRGGTIIPKKLRIRRASSLMIDDPYTLVVALNKFGKAHGELYIDDYTSFEYRKGQFILREFTFEAHTLTSKNLNHISNHFKSRSWLERVIVVGVTMKPSTIELKVNGGTTTSLDFKYDFEKSLLIIRKPAINIATDFSMLIK